jgi:hypothetical protein
MGSQWMVQYLAQLLLLWLGPFPFMPVAQALIAEPKTGYGAKAEVVSQIEV